MLKAATIVLIACAVHAQQIQKVPVQPTSPVSGKAMFTEYCAVCHGNGGRGDGPAAAALKKRPADLTQLSRKNNGAFPDSHVLAFITGDEAVAAHGTRDMPMWGMLFRSLNPNETGIPNLRVRNLADYLKSLQAN